MDIYSATSHIPDLYQANLYWPSEPASEYSEPLSMLVALYVDAFITCMCGSAVWFAILSCKIINVNQCVYCAAQGYLLYRP